MLDPEAVVEELTKSLIESFDEIEPVINKLKKAICHFKDIFTTNPNIRKQYEAICTYEPGNYNHKPGVDSAS